MGRRIRLAQAAWDQRPHAPTATAPAGPTRAGLKSGARPPFACRQALHESGVATPAQLGQHPTRQTILYIVAETAGDETAADVMPDGEIDATTSAEMRRRVLHRDKLRCTAPGCGRRLSLQAHHIRPRSEVGRTIMNNETAVCATCQARIHSDLLAVVRPADGSLRWDRLPSDPDHAYRRMRLC